MLLFISHIHFFDIKPYSAIKSRTVTECMLGTIGVVVRMSMFDTNVDGSIPSINMFSPWARLQDYSLVDICPPSYIQHANHISSRTDHPLKYCNRNPLQINAYKYSFFPRSMNIWNRPPCSAVSHVIPSVDNFHKFAIPAIRDMQPLYGAALI